MATDIFLKIEGIEGEAKASAHANELDILGWHWGVNQEEPDRNDSSSRRRASRPEFEELLITKFIDKASTPLLKACALGNILPKATLTLLSSGTPAKEFLQIEFDKVRVTAIENGGDSSEGRMTENVTFAFEKFKQTYTLQSASGTGARQPEFVFDLVKNLQV